MRESRCFISEQCEVVKRVIIYEVWNCGSYTSGLCNLVPLAWRPLSPLFDTTYLILLAFDLSDLFFSAASSPTPQNSRLSESTANISSHSLSRNPGTARVGLGPGFVLVSILHVLRHFRLTVHRTHGLGFAVPRKETFGFVFFVGFPHVLSPSRLASVLV